MFVRLFFCKNIVLSNDLFIFNKRLFSLNLAITNAKTSITVFKIEICPNLFFHLYNTKPWFN